MSVDAVSPIPEAVAAQARAGQRLSAEIVADLAAVTDILALGALADDRRRARHGARTTFVRVHTLDLAAMDRWDAGHAAAREVRLVGVPQSLDEAVQAVRAARAFAGERPLRGFTLEDLAPLGGRAAFMALAAAGLSEAVSVSPGPGAADLVVASRQSGVCVRVIAAAREPADRAAWLLEARALADAVGNIAAVAPLPRLQERVTPTTGFDDVRTIALARLVLDQVPSVQVDWVQYGPKLAQVALTVGADDLDSVPSVDDLAKGVRRTALEDVRRNIAAAALVPVERDGRFERLEA